MRTVLGAPTSRPRAGRGTAPEMNLGPDCPRCGHPVPFGKAIAGRARAFACRGCGQRLLASKAGAPLAGALFVLLAIAFDQLEGHPYRWPLFISAVVLGCLLEYAFLKVRTAPDQAR
jgi:hypothetical protein